MYDTNHQTHPHHKTHRRGRALLLAGLTAVLAAGLIACSDTEDGDSTGDGTGNGTSAGEDGGTVPSASVVSDEPEDTGVAPPHVTVEATILNNASEDVEINAGDSVTWTNSDDEARTISGDNIESTTIEPGETYTHTFDEEGTYAIDVEGGDSFEVTVLSSLQPEMQGTGVPRPEDGTPASGN